MRNKILITSIIILGILIITNPTNNDFENYISGNENEYEKELLLARTAYLGIFSVYQTNNLDFWKGPQKYNTYVGIFKNFIKISP